jgi:chitinase
MISEISTGLDLLWRNSIPPAKVLLGLGFYGRSFTLEDPGCNVPGCPFKRLWGEDSGGAAPGECTLVSGTLSNYEMSRIKKGILRRLSTMKNLG